MLGKAESCSASRGYIHSHSEGKSVSGLSKPHHLYTGEEGALIVEPGHAQAVGPGMDAWGGGEGEREGGRRTNE